MRLKWVLLGLFVGLPLAVGAGAALVGSRVYVAAGPLADAKVVVVPRGTPDDVASVLLAAGAIESPRMFRAASILTRGDGPLHAGEFLVPAHASLKELLQVLRHSRPVQHRVTIPEGLTAAQIAQVLERTESLSGDDVVPDEGAILPETYVFERGVTRASLVERGRAAMRSQVAQIWRERADGLPLRTEDELVILASVVEKETARPAERARVAAVFVNRLKQGMRLQADPTVVYAASGGSGGLGRPLSRADLDLPSPYNTYRVTGLPPGPIAVPGVAALRAVAHPAPGDELYFVSDGAGGHVFARNLAEHNVNVARYRQLAH